MCATGKGASSGVGFAIPVDTVKGLVEQILQYGRVMRPSLGVVIAPPQALQRIGEDGVLVLDVSVMTLPHPAADRCRSCRRTHIWMSHIWLVMSPGPSARHTCRTDCLPKLLSTYTRLKPQNPRCCPAACLQVTPGSPAAKIGLRPTRRNQTGELILGDIIQGVDGAPVTNAKDLLEQLDAKRVGDKVSVDVLRGRQRLQFSVELADRKLGSGTE
jgi:S1-C subfamily serine protease